MVRQALQAKWDEDEYKKRVEQNKKNHGSETDKSVHTSGFIPFTESRKMMEAFERLSAEASSASAGGSKSSSPPTVDERHIFYQVVSGRNKKGRVYALGSQGRQSYPVGSGSKSSSPPTVDERHIFYQVVSGRNKKGRVYALGSQGRQSYPVGSDSNSSGSYGLSSELEQMRIRATQMNEELHFARTKVIEVQNELHSTRTRMDEELHSART
ncbi:uncharacterized protein LOC127805615 [Diospyros lotus]|uniref:uncharacterized protein LOC127805615 n=1 Tax=Diospyros lotus TaxID=55363 RepID=UPI0022534BAE|nr:uncharacterized protein LOC127805615 [Diospyros lotus]